MTNTRTHRRRRTLASILLLIATLVGAVGAAPTPARAANMYLTAINGINVGEK